MQTTTGKNNRQDRRQALTVILAAYITAQGGLAVLKLTGAVSWHWAAVLTPSWILCGLFLAVIITGIIIGIRDYKRKQRAKEQLQQAIKKSLDDFIKSLETGEEDGE